MQWVGPACEGHTDGETILQIVMLIAVSTIIVFGNSITVVAPKVRAPDARPRVPSTLGRV